MNNTSKKTKANDLTKMFRSMRDEEQEAEVEYARIMIEDRNKTFMDILPPDFKVFKKSIIKSSILKQIESTTEFLNKSPLYEGRIFDRKEVVRYMMRGTGYSNFFLAYKFIPKKDSYELYDDFYDSVRDKKYMEKKRQVLLSAYREKHKDKFKLYSDLDYQLSCLTQVWESYESRQKVKRGELEHDYDMEKDGFPRTSRGNLCYLFIPVKGKWIKDASGIFKLFNPRIRKTVHYHIIKYKKEDDVYMCKDSNGKVVFLADYQSVADSWEALFRMNKEIYAGWWNKILIIK